MSDDILSREDIENMVLEWTRRWDPDGDPKSTKAGVLYWVIPSKIMHEAMVDLMLEFKEEHGYEKKDFSRILSIVLEIISPFEAAKNNQSAKKWQKINTEKWRIAEMFVFPTYKEKRDIPEIKIADKAKFEKPKKENIIYNEDGSIVHKRPSAEGVTGFKSKPEYIIEEEDLLADIEDNE